MNEHRNHTAWRFIANSVAYVESIGKTGDKYAYTSNSENAMKLTEKQCKAFCKYMNECMTQGFWS